MKYVIGRNNLAVTLFVPWDCGRNCPFCTSKKDYADMSDFSLIKICESLDDVIGSGIPVKDLVITGGEPFSNLKQLRILLNSSNYNGLNTYINTTMNGDEKEIINFIKILNHVDGINVSRHIPESISESDKRIFCCIRKQGIKVRINSVVYSDFNKTQIKEFIDSFKNYVDDISFRYDYRKIKNIEDLKGLDNPFFNVLLSVDDMEYTGSGGCHVCNDDHFLYEGKYKVIFHRGFESTKIIVGNTCVINDIIVKQNGDINLDWEDTPIDITELSAIRHSLFNTKLENIYFSNLPYDEGIELNQLLNRTTEDSGIASYHRYINSLPKYVGSCGGGSCGG